MTTLSADEWTPILSRLSAIILSVDRWKPQLTAEALSTGWCGLSPAPENEILKTEQRLGIVLPPSYRSFLSISNGWRPFDSFIERLLPVDEIDRFRSAEPERLAMIQKWFQEDDLPDSDYLDYETPKHNEALRHRYYPESIIVGKAWGSESEMILLNQGIVFPDGEWEAIFFATWLPGNQRYRSFRDLVAERVDISERLEASQSQ